MCEPIPSNSSWKKNLIPWLPFLPYPQALWVYSIFSSWKPMWQKKNTVKVSFTMIWQGQHLDVYFTSVNRDSCHFYRNVEKLSLCFREKTHTHNHTHTCTHTRTHVHFWLANKLCMCVCFFSRFFSIYFQPEDSQSNAEKWK